MTTIAKNQETIVTKLVSNHGYSILKTSLSMEELVKIKRELTVQQVTHPDFPPLKPFGIYEETTRYLRLPIAWAQEHYGQPQQILLKQHPTNHLNFKGTLRPNQEEPVKQSVEKLTKEGRGILCLITGGGKTVCSLAIASQLQQKTLVIVHKRSLMEQWKEEISKYVPQARVGTMIQKTMEYGEDFDITIASWQTLLRRDNIPNAWGLVIVDECHRVCSKEFSQIMFRANARYVLGLSATPQRTDGLTCVLHWHIGKILYQQQKQKRTQLKTLLYVKRYVEPAYKGLRVTGKNYSTVISAITQSQERIECVVETLKKCVYEREDADHRRTLVLTDRVAHAKQIQTLLRNELQSKSVGLFIGQASTKELIEAKKCDIIVATYKIFEEGESVEALNTLVLASPKREITQAVGRIYRKEHEISPIIIDIVDTILTGQGKARQQIIKAETDGHVQVMYVSDEEDKN